MNKYYKEVEAELDLHQMTREEAQKEIEIFLEECAKSRYEKVRIITGKGIHSENSIGVLNIFVRDFLDRGGYKFQNAKYNEGGEGAVEVFL